MWYCELIMFATLIYTSYNNIHLALTDNVLNCVKINASQSSDKYKLDYLYMILMEVQDK